VTSKRTPKYRRQRSGGGDRAFVELEGRRAYLGKYGTEESRQAYHRLIAEWMASGGAAPAGQAEITICEVLALYWAHAESYYRHPDGSPTSTLDVIRMALRPVRELYGTIKAADFGPRGLKAVRERMIAAGWSRGVVNQMVRHVRSVFKWAASEELVPAHIYGALQTLAALRRGRTAARECAPVRPVTDAYVAAVEACVSRQVRAMIQLQLLTAARAGELVIMRPIDLDMTGRIWVYAPPAHKNAHRGRPRAIYIGPRGQELLRPFLRGRAVDAWMFSPAEAEAERRAALHTARKSPLGCGNQPGTNRKRSPERKPGGRYTTGSYRRAITRACAQAFPVPDAILGETDAGLRRQKAKVWQHEHAWGPHQLRHTAATRLRKEFGLEAAQLMLGHARADVTQVYAELNQAKAIELAARIG
jgi:integrase